MAYSKLSEALYAQAIIWAGRWTKLSKQFATSSPTVEGLTPRKLSHIRIQTRVDRQSAQRFSLVLTATGKGARAYEFGSGIHAQRGGRGTYPIYPKKGKFLVFVWERLQQEEPVYLTKVNHPGVEAASAGLGYVRPARKELLRQGRRELGPLAKKAILGDLQQAFREGRRKR